jgi:membrane fusion protein (multidrug efflux system)
LQEARAAVRLAQDVYDRTRRLASRDVSSAARSAEAVARLDVAKARFSLAEVELARTRILAPFDGVTGDRMTAIGDRVEQDIGLVSLAAIGRLQLVFTVPETGVAMASMGTPIQASVIAWPGEHFPGEVFFVAPSIDPISRRLVLKAWIANDDHRLKPGMFANVEVEIAKREDALLIPESSIVYDRNGTYIWRITEDDLAEKIPVKIGLRRSGTVEVVSGIQDGDRVVSAGTHKVMAGDRVNAIEVDPIAQAVDESEMSEGPGVSEDET